MPSSFSPAQSQSRWDQFPRNESLHGAATCYRNQCGIIFYQPFTQERWIFGAVSWLNNDLAR